MKNGDSVPEGWIPTTIEEVAHLNPPKPSRDTLLPKSQVTFVPMVAVDANLGAITQKAKRPFSAVYKGYTAFRENDVIMAKITPCMENGKAAIARGLENGLGFGSTEFHVVRSRGAILAEFVYYFIRQESFRKEAEGEMTGSVGQKRVPADFLRNSEILLPPLAEQKRIVEKVEELIERVNAVKKRLAKASEILKRFRQSVLAAAFSGRLTADWRDKQKRITEGDQLNETILKERKEEWHSRSNFDKKFKPPGEVVSKNLPELPENWKYFSSDALFSFITSGSRGWAKYYTDNGAIFLRIGNLDHNAISLDMRNISHVNPPTGQERERTRVQVGDLLISITADVGMIALVQEPIGEAYVNQHIAIARPVKNVFRPYLAWYLAAKEGGQKQFETLQRGATKVGLGLDDIRSIAIPFPPIEQQKEIIRRIESLFNLADSIGKRIAFATSRAEKLTQAILAKAFRGELVPTEAELARREGRSYEPASFLLSRIKEENEGEAKKRRSSINKNPV